MKLLNFIALFTISLQLVAQNHPLNKPIVGGDVVFEEKDGILAVEAEYFYKQTANDTRAWYITAKDRWAKPGRDADGPHVKNASNNAYIEILPDTRVTHGDKLIKGENFNPDSGEMCNVHCAL